MKYMKGIFFARWKSLVNGLWFVNCSFAFHVSVYVLRGQKEEE